jgi:hypothetical protein
MRLPFPRSALYRVLYHGIALTAGLALAACGGRTAFYPGDGGGVNGNGNGNTNANANANANANTNTNTNGACDHDSECHIAWQADRCCSCPEPVSSADLAADPCLIPIAQSAMPTECQVDCPGIDCAECPPNPGAVTCDEGEGQCVWDEDLRCQGDEQCLLGVRVDDCCTQAFGASRALLEAEPCVVPWPPAEIPGVCRDRWEQNCDFLNCTWSGPPSRNTICDDGSCEPVPECSQPDDCAIAVNGRQCCACPEAWPRQMLGHDECLVRPGEPVPPHCPMMSCLADCGPCPEVTSTCQSQLCTTVYGVPGDGGGGDGGGGGDRGGGGGRGG